MEWASFIRKTGPFHRYRAANDAKSLTTNLALSYQPVAIMKRRRSGGKLDSQTHFPPQSKVNKGVHG
uniref:(California timema) hypothetical protein n=1 Tax=Timema californicum TaxID=61474 RepID=A0A7R9JAG6_TIMCA|nr:unnamed protein product [Timema californicum]